MDEYITVFKISNEGMKYDWLLPVPFILIGIGLIVFSIRVDKKILSNKSLMGLVMVIFLSFWCFNVAKIQFSQYKNRMDVVSRGAYKTVAGIAQNFDPMPRGGHKQESFDIDGVRFEYSDYEVIDGFNNTCSHGGPICRNGQELKIDYLTRNGRNYILLLKIKRDDLPSLQKEMNEFFGE